jgi:hypothetical protein
MPVLMDLFWTVSEVYGLIVYADKQPPCLGAHSDSAHTLPGLFHPLLQVRLT